MRAVGFNRLFDLSGQFARRGQNKNARTAWFAKLEWFGEQHMQDGQGKTCGFTRPGLSSGQQVTTSEDAGDGLCLNGSGCGIASIGNRTQKRIGQPEVSKSNRSRQENSSIVMPAHK